jgi:hypothetical protein
MPKILGGHDPVKKQCWNDLYEAHDETLVGVNAALKASTWQSRKHLKGGWNGAAVQARIDYLRKMMNIGFVDSKCMRRAQATVANLEGQL